MDQRTHAMPVSYSLTSIIHTSPTARYLVNNAPTREQNIPSLNIFPHSDVAFLTVFPNRFKAELDVMLNGPLIKSEQVATAVNHADRALKRLEVCTYIHACMHTYVHYISVYKY